MNFSREDKIRKDVTEFYNNVAWHFSQTRRNWWVGLDFFEKYIKSKDRVLDFGCGNGRFLEFVYQKDLKINYRGVDVSEELINLAKEKYKKESFSLIENEQNLPFKKSEFDVVVSIAVFHHFNSFMAEKSLKEIKRVLKKDGIVIITAWYLWNGKRVSYLIKSLLKNLLKLNFEWSANLPFSYSDKNKGQKTYWRTCYWWTKRGLEKVARKNNFTILESGYSRDDGDNRRNIYLVLKKS